MTLAKFLHAKVAGLIERVQEESHRAMSDTSEERIHHLRVAIRRLSETLTVFADLFPNESAKVVRKDLKSAMKLAGETRNHDIARELMARARVKPDVELAARRAEAAGKLAVLLSKWNQDTAFTNWREQLQCLRN